MAKEVSRTRVKLKSEGENEESKSRMIFTEVGRAVVHLSNVENELSYLYHHLTFHHYLGTPEAMAVFYAQPRFDGKVLLVDLLMRIEASKEFFERWGKIVKEIRRYRVVRNLVAHQGLYVSFPDREGRVDVWLDPAELNSRYDSKTGSRMPNKGRPVHLAEVKTAADALEEIRRDLARLLFDLEQYDLPSHLRADYVEPEDNDE